MDIHLFSILLDILTLLSATYANQHQVYVKHVKLLSKNLLMNSPYKSETYHLINFSYTFKLLLNLL